MHIGTRILLALVLSACLVLTPHCKPKSTESEPAGKPTATPTAEEIAKAVEQLKSDKVDELLAAAKIICQSDDEAAWKALQEALVKEEVLNRLKAKVVDLGEEGGPAELRIPDFAQMMRIIAEGKSDKATATLMWLVDQKPYAETFAPENRDERKPWRSYLAYNAFEYIAEPSKDLLEYFSKKLESKTLSGDLRIRILEALAAYGTPESLALFKTQLWGYGQPILLVKHRNNYECVRLFLDTYRDLKESESAHKMLDSLFMETYRESEFWPEEALPKINPQGEEAKKFIDLFNGFLADPGKIALTEDETKKIKELIASIEKANTEPSDNTDGAASDSNP